MKSGRGPASKCRRRLFFVFFGMIASQQERSHRPAYWRRKKYLGVVLPAGGCSFSSCWHDLVDVLGGSGRDGTCSTEPAGCATEHSVLNMSRRLYLSFGHDGAHDKERGLNKSSRRTQRFRKDGEKEPAGGANPAYRPRQCAYARPNRGLAFLLRPRKIISGGAPGERQIVSVGFLSGFW